MKTLYLIDGMGLLYRGYYVFIKNPRVTSNGLNTSALYGFTLILLEILEKYQPQYIAVVLDSPEPTFRHKQYEQYKAERPPQPEPITQMLPYLKEFLNALGIPLVQLAGYEADDIIGTLAKKAQQQGFQVYIVSSDKDLAQLLQENIFLIRPGKQGQSAEIINHQNAIDHFGVPPEAITDLLALKGDKVDGIPGIKGIGEKTAIKLLQQFKTIENLYENLTSLSSKTLKEKLQQGKEQAFLSKTLAQIDTNAPLDLNIEELQRKTPDKETLAQLLQTLEFHSIAKRLNIPLKDTTQLQKQLPQIPFEEVQNLEEVLKKLQTQENLAILCTPLNSNPIHDKPHYLVIATKEKCYGFPPQLWDSQQQWQSFFKQFQGLWITYNCKHLLHYLRNLFQVHIKRYFDILLADYLLHAEQNHKLDSIVKRHLNYNLSLEDEPSKQMLPFWCAILLSLHETLEKQLQKEQLKNVLEQIEHPLVPVLAAMEHKGILLDAEQLQQYEIELDKQLFLIQQKIFQLAGKQFNINSPKQLAEVLYQDLKLPVLKRTKKGGEPSTDEQTLHKLAVYHELPLHILEYRALAKLKNTYVKALPQYVNPKTGRIHATFNQAGTVTGRLSSQHPNLQNIPIRSPWGRQIRKAFIAPEGFTLLSADYSQIELRIMAHFSKDPAMLQAFREDKDIHTTTAALLFDVKEEEVTAEMRRTAKMVNFGLMYGMSAHGLAERLHIRRREKKKIIDNYFKRYPKIQEFMQNAIAKAKEKGYAETLFGHRHYLPNLYSKNPTLRGYAERNAINTPLQGTAAEIIKLAMIAIYQWIAKEQLPIYLILQIHDELLFEVQDDYISIAKEKIQTLMENIVRLDVPLKVHIHTGKHWLMEK